MNKKQYTLVLVSVLALIAMLMPMLAILPGPALATAPTITVTTPTTATISTAYTLKPSASGGTAPYYWTATGKPSWLSLNANTGAMTGTPGTSAVTVTFTLQVKDKIGTKATKDITINVNAAPALTITVTTPTTATIGTAYTLKPSASGGTAPYYWTATGKPNWLSLNANTGAMTGTPGTSAVTVTFTLQVKDKIGTKATKDITINVNAAPAPTITVTTPTTATIGTAYTLKPSASGGTTPYYWTATGKPSWLSLNANTGAMTGTPGTSAVTVTFTLQVKDKIGTKATKDITINVNAAPAPTITVTTPTTATIGTAYTLKPSASGGTTPYYWTATGKPSWLSLNANTGAMTGTPGTSAVTVTFTLQVKDKIGTKATKDITINVNQVSNDPIVSFPDPGLQASVRTAINKPAGDIHASDLVVLTALNAISKGITNIKGLEYCINLVDLRLADNQISNLAPLSGLTKLRVLLMNINQVSDLTPLTGLVQLNTLELGANKISNLTPLAGLINLMWLTLDNNQISDLAPLAGLTNLKSLGLSSNQISNLTSLTGLTTMEFLGLSTNQISNLAPLSGLIKLINLQLGYNQISNLVPLTNLINLNTVWLIGNQINDISPLVNNTGLGAGDSLQLKGNPLSSTSVTSYIPALQARGVTVEYDPPASTDPVVTFPDPGLQAAIRTAINKPTGDIHASELAILQGLYADGKEIINLTGLEYCTNLTFLDLDSNQITNLSPLAGLTNLTGLLLQGNKISNLSPLAGLPNLINLGLVNNQISNISPLVNNTGLGTGDSVYLNSNPLGSASVTIYIPALKARGVMVWWDTISPPPPPSNMQVVATDSTHISVTWTDNSGGLASFNISDNGTLNATVNPGTTSCTFSNLTPNTNYCFHVQSFNSTGNSNWTDYACATTPPAPPLPSCPCGTGPDGITAGDYNPTELTQEKRQWLFEAFGHSGIAPVGYGGERCTPLRSCPSGTGPGGITAGDYNPTELTQEKRQWLFEAFGHSGIAPVGYGGERCCTR